MKLPKRVDELIDELYKGANLTNKKRLDELIKTVKNVKRRILYTDTINGEWTYRDDLWAISTSELQAIQNLIAQEANKAVVAELKIISNGENDGTWEGYGKATQEYVDSRIAQLTAYKEQAL